MAKTAEAVKTLEDLQAEIRRVQAVVDAWESMPDEASPVVSWRGGARKAISEAVANAWADLVDYCDTPDFADGAKQVVLAVDAFESALIEWSTAVEIDSSNTDPGGSPKLWNAWQSIGQVRPIQFSQPDPIKSLIEIQGVSDRQIALQYGFDDVRMVREEYEHPGTHYNPKTWEPPTHRRRMAKIEAEWAKRSDRRRHANPNKPKEKRIAPESLDQLIEQRVPSRQIAEMKGITVDEVRERADYLGLPLDGNAPTLAASGVDRMADIRRQDDLAHAQAKQMGQRGPHPDIENVLERVAACASDGMNPGAIAAALKSEYPGLTGPKVAKMLEPVAKG
jgi:hypothetical protein